MNEKISIVIPCLNEEKYIDNTLSSLVMIDYPPELTEILIVDGGSNDGTHQIIEKYRQNYPYIKILKNDKRITPAALNLGIANASGSLIMIAGAHSQYPANYISELLKLMKELDCDVIGGAVDTKIKNSTSVSEAIVKILSSSYGVGNSSFRTENHSILEVDTVPFGIYKKTVFKKCGLYNESLVRNHDIELSKRMIGNGIKIYLVSSLRCTYFARETYWELAKNNFKNGFWNILTVYRTKKLRSLSIRHFIPFAFILSIICPLIPGICISSYFLALPFFSIAAYSFFVMSASLKLKDKSAKFFFIVHGLIVLHFSYGLGSLAGLFRIDRLFVKDRNLLS